MNPDDAQQGLSHACAWCSAFQTSPLDLSTPRFYMDRRAVIEARLGEVEAGAAPALLREAWAAHHGVMCVGVNWERQGAARGACAEQLSET